MTAKRGTEEEGMIERRERKGVWEGYFEQQINNVTEGEAVVTTMGIEPSRDQVLIQRKIGREEVEKAIARLKCGKATGMDGIAAEMLKHGGDAVVEWMLLKCEQAWKKGEVPYGWKKAIIVPLYKGKGSRSECSTYRGDKFTECARKSVWENID